MDEQKAGGSKKWVLWGIVAIVLITVGFTVFKKPVETGPIKIGVILPLSGDLASFGAPAREGAQLALNDFTNTKHQYELLFEDDQFTGTKTISAVNKLVSIDKVNAVVSFGSSGGNVVKPLATKNKIIHFAVASDPSIPDGIYNFNHWTPPSEEARVMVSELQRRSIKNIAVLAANQQGMIAVSKALEDKIQNSGINIVSKQIFNLGETDFRALIAKVRVTNPEIYVFICSSPELEIIATQMKEAGIKTPMTSIEGFDATNHPELFTGDWYVTASDPMSDFVDAFKLKYGIAPGYGTPNVYDIVSILVTAIENTRASNPTAEQIARELHKIQNLKGALGSLTIDSNGQVVSTAIVKVVGAK